MFFDWTKLTLFSPFQKPSATSPGAFAPRATSSVPTIRFACPKPTTATERSTAIAEATKSIAVSAPSSDESHEITLNKGMRVLRCGNGVASA